MLSSPSCKCDDRTAAGSDVDGHFVAKYYCFDFDVQVAVGDADVHLVVLGSCVGCSRCRFRAFQLGMKHLRVPFARFVYPPVTNVSLDPIII